METSEGPPMEEREEEHIPEEENIPRSRFRDNQDFLNFLDELRENEEKCRK